MYFSLLDIYIHISFLQTRKGLKWVVSVVLFWGLCGGGAGPFRGEQMRRAVETEHMPRQQDSQPAPASSMG